MAEAEPRIDRARNEQRAAALGLVLRDLQEPFRSDHISQLMQSAAADPTLLGGLWVAIDRPEKIVGAAWVQFHNGATATIWVPQLEPGQLPSTGQRLLAALASGLEDSRVRIAQALLDKSQTLQAEWLVSAGIAHLTDLLYLVSLEEAFPADPPATDFDFEPFQENQYSRLAQVVEKTYRQTLDCPQLNDVRNIDDVLAGYRANGQFAPERWLIVSRGGDDVGCLLLTEHAESNQWELVYMGLVPEARGHGWGTQIVRYAQWLARLAHRSRLVLAVDAANVPAIAVYTAAGFVSWDERSVFLRVFPDRRQASVAQRS
jgi:GNAT superfamily N-acetyltransferase